MTEGTSRQRNTSRTLYPDLTSAHAQIQGHRTVSLQAARSSGMETRFPLSPSSSSSGEEDGVDFDISTLGSDAIPLQDLSCQRVPSAFGVLHEADYHQESSAIIQSSDDAETPDTSERYSCTLDEIVSQYVDATTESSSSGHPGHGSLGLNTGMEHFTDFEDPDEVELRPESFASSLDNRVTNDENSTSGHRSHDLHRGRRQSQLHALENPARQESEEKSDDEEWSTLPESSRSGFLTPSKLRFRLIKRETKETLQSGTIGGRSPATTWDPLSNVAQVTHRPGLQDKHRLQICQRSKSSSPGSNRVVLTDGGDTATERQEDDQEVTKGHSLNTASTLDHNTQSSQQLDQHFPQRRAEHFSLNHTSDLPSNSFVTRITDNILPSSSLLPHDLDKTVMSSSLPQTAMSRVRKIKTPTSSEEIGLTALPAFARNTEQATKHTGNTASDNTFLPMNPETISAGPVSNENEKFSSTSRGATGGQAKKKSEQSKTHIMQGGGNSEQAVKALLHEHFIEGGYSSSDSDISRFLRNTQHLRQDLRSAQDESMAPIDRSARIKVTGSSIANYSSDSAPLKRSKYAKGLGDRTSGTRKDTEINNNVSGRFRKLLSSAENVRDSASVYSNLSNASSASVTNSSDANTSASLLSAEINANPSLTSHAGLIDKHHCPTFPLAPELLAITKIPETGRVPFERLQLLEDGSWLEKAWCSVHQRMEFSQASLGRAPVGAIRGSLPFQREAGKILLVVSVATYFVGGFALAHDMGTGGALATGAMVELTKWLSGQEEGAVGRVHPVDARLARAVEKVGLLVVGVVALGCVGVLVWAATTN